MRMSIYGLDLAITRNMTVWGLTRSIGFGLALAVLLSLSTGLSANAQNYPDRAIRIVVGFPPGGGVDTTARVVGMAMSQDLGQPMVVENKPGAAGTIGAADVARSTPDGYTLLVTPGGHSIFGAIFQSLPFDTVKSFDWISNIVTVPFLVVVPSNSEFKSLADIIAKAKSTPNTVTFGSAGQGTTHHLGVELLGIRTNTKFVHVPYRGDAPLINAVLAGEVQFAIATPTLVLQNMKTGALRVLAVTTHSRSPELPEVPTVEESLRIPDYDVGTWFALAGPAGMPPPVVTKLNATIRKALASPDVKSRLAGIGGEISPTTPDQMRDRVARELATWTVTVHEAHIEKQ
jgi:tripartite-type tricarboxylate transporter receptor subunit TctC